MNCFSKFRNSSTLQLQKVYARYCGLQEKQVRRISGSTKGCSYSRAPRVCKLWLLQRTQKTRKFFSPKSQQFFNEFRADLCLTQAQLMNTFLGVRQRFYVLNFVVVQFVTFDWPTQTIVQVTFFSFPLRTSKFNRYQKPI